MPPILRVLLTIALVLAAITGGILLWQDYVLSPWTRDGRVRADVITLAPDVAGRIVELHVKENQTVKRGDILLVIDQGSYKVALQEAEGALAASEAEMNLAKFEAQRRDKLSSLAISAEDRQRADLRATAASALYQQAVARRDAAKLNLDRTVLAAPVAGFVTNLELNPGDYANAGQALLALIDAGSFRVEGYFEETKLRRIAPGAAAEIRLMSGGPPLQGKVGSIARGIGDTDNPTGRNLLREVTPTFQWVRLAQRVPVRIELDPLPEGVVLAAGMTATIVIETSD